MWRKRSILSAWGEAFIGAEHSLRSVLAWVHTVSPLSNVAAEMERGWYARLAWHTWIFSLLFAYVFRFFLVGSFAS